MNTKDFKDVLKLRYGFFNFAQALVQFSSVDIFYFLSVNDVAYC